jgi:hypothetical protein
MKITKRVNNSCLCQSTKYQNGNEKSSATARIRSLCLSAFPQKARERHIIARSWSNYSCDAHVAASTFIKEESYGQWLLPSSFTSPNHPWWGFQSSGDRFLLIRAPGPLQWAEISPCPLLDSLFLSITRFAFAIRPQGRIAGDIRAFGSRCFFVAS